jgi:tetratricopeptide (TPR) repeat protein
MAAVYEMQGDIGRSRSYYETLIAENPRNSQAISGLVRLALQDGSVNEARLVLERGLENGIASHSLRKDWAALDLMSGDLPKARTILQAITDEQNVNPMTLAMLAMVMIEQGEFASVESKILPKLIKMEKGEDNYFVHVIQGRVLQMKGKQWFSQARKQFIRAYAQRPDVTALREIIFRLDMALEDRSAAEAHAIEILRVNPAHALANFFMGSVALEAGEYGKAEGYLRRSAEDAHPTVEALNNYAQLLCRIRRTDEAVKIARRATELAPERYEVWSTLAYILLDVDELDEASQALVKASALNKDDKRLFIIDGLIAMKRGDLVSVKRAVEMVEKDSEDLPVTSQRDLQLLKKSLAEHP